LYIAGTRILQNFSYIFSIYFQERLLPRNMQLTEQQQQVDGDGFINVQLELPPESEEAEPLARNSRIGKLPSVLHPYPTFLQF
jgi:hypothetical protein